MRKRLMLFCAVALAAGLVVWTCSKKSSPTGPSGIAPTITTQPASQTVNEGSPASFTVDASGDPAPGYQWQRNDTAIAGATSATYAIASATAANSGSYRVIVTNSAGRDTSDPATLTVRIAPAITTQPVSQTVNEGSPASFTVDASGDPAPGYQWQRNDTAIAGATSATYVIASATAANSGSYRVIVTNSAGRVTSNSVLLVVIPSAPAAPSIIVQPQSLTVDEGGSATFTVVTTGNPAPQYQWRKNGTDISGATNDLYYISSATQADAAIYTVYVWNSQGNVTSIGATLTVNPAPYVWPYTVSGDSMSIYEPPQISSYTYCNGTTLVTQYDTSGGTFGMRYTVSGNILSLYECDTVYMFCDTENFIRVGTGTGLIGTWIFNTYLSDTLIFTPTTVAVYFSGSNNYCYADDWMSWDWAYDSIGFKGTAAEISCTQVKITGNTTGEQVTINWNSNGDMTYTSTNSGHAAYTYYQNPTSCPDDYSPDWYYTFLGQNNTGTPKRAVRPSIPRIRKHQKFLLFR
ncbi:MAG: immunoglobulin domain-containing protein [Chitinispirillaceae bacterium]|jgi:hypothetical protein